MAPKETMPIKIGVKRGILFLNDSAVTTVYDSRNSAWFRSNDIADALGYANASSSVTAKIPAEYRRQFKEISLRVNSIETDSHPRNVFVNQRGLIGFLRECDSSCDVAKVRDMSQSSISGQVPANSTVVHDRTPAGRSFQNEVAINVKGSSLFLNGIAVETVYDLRNHAWFKSNDVATALGFTNASSSVTQRIHPNHKLSFSDISLHKNSPPVSAHPRNVFINQDGLVSFLLSLSPSCSVQKIQNIGLSLNNNKPVNRSTVQTHSDYEPSRHHAGSTYGQMESRPTTECEFFINKNPITIVIDSNKNAWFKMNDVASGLGYTNVGNLISQYISEEDKISLKDIDLHENAPSVSAHPRNIFINQKGLVNILFEKKCKADDVTVGFPQSGATKMKACDKITLEAMYRCIKEFNQRTAEMDSVPKNSGLKASTTILTPAPSQHSTSSTRNLSSYSHNPHPYESDGYWLEGYISIIEGSDSVDDSFKLLHSTEDPEKGSNKHIFWSQRVHSAPKLLKFIQYFLSDWISDCQMYNMPLRKLHYVVSNVCKNFEKTLNTVYKLTSNNVSKPSSTNLQPITKDQITALAASPKYNGEWIYIASSMPYAGINAFKVGSTSRLAKRLASYQTGRLNEDVYHYFAVFPVHNCVSVDNNFIQFFLRPWRQLNSHGVPTEMYCNLDFGTLNSIVREITNFHENAFKCISSL